MKTRLALVASMLLFVTASQARPPARTFRGNGVRATIAPGGQGFVVRGSNNVLHLRGLHLSVTIIGNHNTVTVDDAREIPLHAPPVHSAPRGNRPASYSPRSATKNGSE